MKKLFLCLAVLAVGLSFYTVAQAMDVTIAWDPNSEADLAGYRVYYGTASGTYLQPKGSGLGVPLAALPDKTKPEYKVTGLTRGTSYYFVVTAYDSEVPSLESGYSNEVSTNGGPVQPGGTRIKVVVDVQMP